MSDIKIFENSEFGRVRTIENGNNVLFCAPDVARALGYADTSKAVKQHCKSDGWAFYPVIDSKGRAQEARFINEGNVYRLIVHSKLPGAERFEHWVFDGVLPSIRKTGGYISGQESMTDDELMAKALLVAQRQIKQRDARIAEMQPKALFADSVCASKSSILVGELAKILKQNGVNMGQNRLFEWLRNNGYLIRRKGTDYNMPTQRAMELKLFEIKETVVNHADGHQTTNKTPKVTGKGQVYFINAFLKEATHNDASNHR